MNAQGHIIVPLERKGADGKDAVHIEPTVSNIEFAEGQVIDESLEVRAYRGSEQIALTTSMVAVTYTPRDMTVGYLATNGVVLFSISRDSSDVKVDDRIEYTVTIDDVVYTKVCGVKSVFNGDKGDPGDPGEPGEDAIYYELELSCETLEYNAFADAFAPSTIDIQVMKVEGTTRSYVNFRGTVRAVGDEGSLSQTISDTTSFTYTPFAKSTPSGVTRYYTHIDITVYPSENLAVQLTKTIYPTTSYYPRVRYWEDVAEGGKFCQGKLGEQYRDIVIHPRPASGQNPQYFYCYTSHTKSDDKEPQSGTKTQWWYTMNYYETVATNLLLADTAKINNLYVDDLFMVGEASAIWINPNHEGMKIVRASDLTSDEYKDQSGESAWLKPTAYFHANSIPEMADYYGGSQISGSGSIGTWTYTAGDTVFSTTETVQKSGTIATLPSGRSLAISVPAISISITEGDEDISLDASLVNVGVWACLGNGATEGKQGVTIEFPVGSASGDTKSGTIATQTINITNGTGTSQAVWLEVRIWNTSLKSGAIVQQTNTINVSALGDVLTGYASQYGADGMFMAVSDASYFRVKVQESAQQYSMFADGTGIDITQQGAIQKVAGNSMPLGGCLALVNISTSAGLAAFDVWTFDGESLSGQYYGTGIYRVFFPSSWADKFGAFDAYKMVVTTSYQSNGNTIGVSVQKGTYSGYWGYLNIHVVNGTTYTDVPVSLRIDYMSSVTSREMSQSTSAITPLSMIQDAEIINE